MTRVVSRALALWLPLVTVLTGAFLFAYWGIQQSYRLNANDPQVELAEDGAARLAAGAPPASLVTRGIPLTDITTSIAPWLAVFDASGTPLASSASIGPDPLRLPAGVFDRNSWKLEYAAYGVGMNIPADETRFSWQPRPGVRQAVVLMRVSNGMFVASGRNMREPEERIEVFTKGAVLLWSATALTTLFTIILFLAIGLL